MNANGNSSLCLPSSTIISSKFSLSRSALDILQNGEDLSILCMTITGQIMSNRSVPLSKPKLTSWWSRGRTYNRADSYSCVFARQSVSGADIVPTHTMVQRRDLVHQIENLSANASISFFTSSMGYFGQLGVDLVRSNIHPGLFPFHKIGS